MQASLEAKNPTISDDVQVLASVWIPRLEVQHTDLIPELQQRIDEVYAQNQPVAKPTAQAYSSQGFTQLMYERMHVHKLYAHYFLVLAKLAKHFRIACRIHYNFRKVTYCTGVSGMSWVSLTARACRGCPACLCERCWPGL